jgi:hypothetical protein
MAITINLNSSAIANGNEPSHFGGWVAYGVGQKSAASGGRKDQRKLCSEFLTRTFGHKAHLAFKA